MKYACICFSLTGEALAQKLAGKLRGEGHEAEVFCKSKYLDASVSISLGEWTRDHWHMDGLIFIGACQIAVRAIAPFVRSKKTDPAVIAADECGNYVIALLSGHLGGANELAQKAAEFLNAQAVVTTATDLHKQFAVDVFARKQGLELFPMSAAKAVSAAVLAGETVGLYTRFPVEKGELPGGLILWNEKTKGEKPSVGIVLGIEKTEPVFETTLYLVPKIVTAGVGCRRGKSREAVLERICDAVKQAGIFKEAVGQLASIDLKQNEEGILEAAKELEVPFRTYSSEELLKAKGEFLPSAFVTSVTGVDNVCERSAVLASGQGQLIMKKTAADAVTCALAVRDWSVHFE